MYIGLHKSEEYIEDKVLDATTYLYGRIKEKKFRPMNLGAYAYWASKMAIFKYKDEEMAYNITDLEAFTGMPLEDILNKEVEENTK